MLLQAPFVFNRESNRIKRETNFLEWKLKQHKKGIEMNGNQKLTGTFHKFVKGLAP